MNYIGSKKSLLKFLETNIDKVVWRKNYTFSDLFAGTGVVWKHFKEKWHKIISNDIQYYSYILNQNYIWNHTDLYFSKLKEIPELFIWNVNTFKEIILKYLNKLPWKKWFIYKNYCPEWTKWQEFERKYFSKENAMKCDAIRQKIENWKKTNQVNKNEYYFLLSSLLESIDKVANTTSVYWAFLKNLKKSAKIQLQLKPAEFYLNSQEHQVFNSDINTLVKNTSHDVVYLDPPYNHRQYSWNYHILETICLYDEPKIYWKTWMRDCSKQKSGYSKKTEVLKTFDNLIQNINAKYIFLSYNDEGLMSLEEIKKIMSKRWEYSYIQKKYHRYKADKTENRNHKKDTTIEYLHHVKILS